jgi:hypothetical protein
MYPVQSSSDGPSGCCHFHGHTDQNWPNKALLYERNLLYALMDNQPDRIFFKDADLRYIKSAKSSRVRWASRRRLTQLAKHWTSCSPVMRHGVPWTANAPFCNQGSPDGKVEKSVDASGRAHWDSVSMPDHG